MSVGTRRPRVDTRLAEDGTWVIDVYVPKDDNGNAPPTRVWLGDDLISDNGSHVNHDQREAWPTVEQMEAIAHRLARGDKMMQIQPRPFDLPNDYLLVVEQISGFTCGVAPDGRVSS